ncbi:twinfilin-1-like [Pristis pectinata]|uniref:twinfilin-1-like n=1 Tax=Pristis pectinata TaxID=685728 RepID=UPI00223D2EF2|nr:twinfilin-1-like [Pristis pectinata]
MSLESGVTASKELLELFSKSKDGSIRMIQVLVQEGYLVPHSSHPPRGSWEEDYEGLLLPALRHGPCYILYRLDSRNAQGPEWVLIAWTPESSTLRHKMLYASSRAAVKKEFGGGHIKEEIHATMPDEVSLEGYRRHLASKAAPAPLTVAEQELQQMKISEINTDINVDSKRPTLQGVAFPIEDDALAALQRLKEKRFPYVQLRLDTEREVITLVDERPIEVADLPAQVPADSPRWHFFLYKHSHEGETLESLIFIYSMPGSNCTIKERMLYSSCKGPFITSVEQQLGLDIAKKVEIDQGSELTPDFLYGELHPPQHAPRPTFDKPPGPARSRGGPRRIVRPTTD